MFDEVLNAGNLNVLEMLAGINYKEHSPLLGQPDGREGVRFRIEALRGAFPDIRFTLDELVGEDDIVAARYHWQGAQNGVFMSSSPLGKRVSVTSIESRKGSLSSTGTISMNWV